MSFPKWCRNPHCLRLIPAPKDRCSNAVCHKCCGKHCVGQTDKGKGHRYFGPIHPKALKAMDAATKLREWSERGGKLAILVMLALWTSACVNGDPSYESAACSLTLVLHDPNTLQADTALVRCTP